MKQTLLRLALIAQTIALFATAAPAVAQGYPQKPIRMVLGYPAGSGIFLPAKAPPEITRLLEKTIREAVSDPALVASLHAIGVEPWLGNADDLAKAVVSDTEKWGRIIRRAGIVAE